jgi:hypothetical protein
LFSRFLYGWIIHTGYNFVSAFPLLIRNPSKISILLKDVDNLKFGAFLASITAIYRVSI